MTMSKTEKQVIRLVIERLKCLPRHDDGKKYGESEAVRLALTGSVDPHEILSEKDFTSAQRRVFFGADGEPANGYAGAARTGRAARLYLDSWVTGALSCLLEEDEGGTGRDLKLALDLAN